jgi:hypothetical protein
VEQSKFCEPDYTTVFLLSPPFTRRFPPACLQHAIVFLFRFLWLKPQAVFRRRFAAQPQRTAGCPSYQLSVCQAVTVGIEGCGGRRIPVIHVGGQRVCDGPLRSVGSS